MVNARSGVPPKCRKTGFRQQVTIKCEDSKKHKGEINLYRIKLEIIHLRKFRIVLRFKHPDIFKQCWI